MSKLTRSLALLLLFAASLESMGQRNGFYYYVGKHRRIELTIATEYVAFWLSATEAAALKKHLPRAEKKSSATLLLGNILLSPASSKVSPKEFLGAQSTTDRTVNVFRSGEFLLIPTDEVLVQVKAEAPVGRLQKLLGPYQHEQIRRNGYVLHVSPADALNVANLLAQDQDVQHAEPNFTTLIPAPPKVEKVSLPTVGAAPTPHTPNDLYFPQQWSLENKGFGTAGVDLRLQPAWKATTGYGVTIAILDLGVDITHPDLSNKIVKPFNAITNGSDQSPSSADDYHGTACAGLAAAATNNLTGVAGVGWNSNLMPIKVAKYVALTNTWETSPRILARGIDAAVQAGADVLSNSWSTAPSSEIDDAIDRALSEGRAHRGALLVFAAGNSGGRVEYPANTATQRPIIAVSATNEWDELKTVTSKDGENYWASNFGPEITVAAPGVHLFTTNLVGGSSANAGDYIPNFHGTSASAPIVAGVVALILSVHPGFSAQQIVDVLAGSADDLGAPGVDDEFGHGRVNACKAVGAPSC